MAGCAPRRGGASNVYADHVGPLALKYMRYDIEVGVEEAFCAYVRGVCEIGEGARTRGASLTESGRSGPSDYIPTTK
jgi:hypothetical protein